MTRHLLRESNCLPASGKERSHPADPANLVCRRN
jgi:hypothetical protein